MLSLRLLNQYRLLLALAALTLLGVIAYLALNLAQLRWTERYPELVAQQLALQVEPDLQAAAGDPSQVLAQAMSTLGLDGYAELRRPGGSATILGSSGDPAQQSATDPVTYALPRADFELQLWLVRSDPPRDLVKLLAGGAAITALLLLLVTRLMDSAATRALKHDQHLLARMFKDIRSGMVHQGYPIQLAEFRELSRYLTESGGKLVQERRRLEDMGMTDHLSKLPNRRALDQRLEQLFLKSGTGFPMSVLLLDIDHFKQVNDNLGHDAGDELVSLFAAALRQELRETDFVARMGGDEFCVLFPYTELETACNLAERLRQHLPQTLELKPGTSYIVSWTGGLSAIERGDTDHEQVLWRADKALLMAKQAGRKRSYYHRSDSIPKQA
jgi:diguanylate cyclase (GGDEF)-like protein